MEFEYNSESNSNDEDHDDANCQEIMEINIDYESWYRKEPKIKDLIMDLRNRIDSIIEHKKILREHILELARKLKESKLCDENKISITIKAILKEEIKDKKISSRWIEKILSDQYKRKYEKANCSLSNKKKQVALLGTDNSGKSFTITPEENTSTIDKSEKKHSFDYPHNDREEQPTDFESSNIDLIRENKELKEALEKTTKFQTTNSLKEIQLYKEKSTEIITALDKCTSTVFIGFDAKGVIQSIEPDTIREQQFENVNDNYT